LNELGEALGYATLVQ